MSEAERRATAALLWAAARPFPDPAAIVAACDETIDVDLFAKAALEQWAGPLVWRGISLADCVDRIGDAAEPLRSNAARWYAKAHFVAGSVETAVTPLTQAGLEPVVLKGAALAERYPEPSLRPIADIDLMLPPGDHDAALGALDHGGWKVVKPLDRIVHETLLAHPDLPTLTVELHAGFDRWHNRMTGLDAASLWQRRRAATFFGTDAFALGPEDELIFLAAHAGKPFHSFDRLMWFADLVVVIEAAKAEGGIDWDLVGHRARAERCSTVLAVALKQAARLGAEVPSGLLPDLPRRGWRRTVLAPMLEADWPLTKPDPVTQRRSRYALCETWGRRLLLFIGESPYEPLRRQPLALGQRAWMAAFGFPRLMREKPAIR